MSRSLCALKSPCSKPWLLMSDKNFFTVAKDIIKRAKGEVEPTWIEWKTFPDGTPNIRFNAHTIEGRDVVLIGSLDHPDSLLSFISVVYAVPRYLAKTFTVIIPFFPTATMERVEHEGDIATAKTLARLFSATPAPQLGETTFVFFDIHALPIRFYFSDNVKVQFQSALPLFLRKLEEAEAKEGRRPAIAFPDEGAKKRFGTWFKKYDLLLCIKTRVGDKRELILQEGDCRDRHVFIVDDLVQSGGTLLTCQKLLYAKGAQKVSAYVTHGVFPRDSWKKFLVSTSQQNNEKPFATFYLTDSVPKTIQAIQGQEPFKVLTLAQRITELLRNPDGAQNSSAHEPPAALPAKL